MRRKSGKYPVLFKGGRHRMSTRFHLFVSNVNQGNEGARWIQYFFYVAAGMERLSLDLLRAVENIAGCRSVWNL